MKSVVLKGRKIPRIAWNALNWHFQYYRGGSPKPMAVGLFVTNLCNLSCAMCSIWRDRKKTTLSHDRLLKLVEAVTPGCCYFSFSGGEPLLVEGIDRMVAAAARRIPYIHLVSNGLLVTPELSRRLAKAGLAEISLSLDGDRQWHNAVRNNQAGYDAVIAAVGHLRIHAPSVKIVLNTVLFPTALGQARFAVKKAAELGVLIKLQPVSLHFRFECALNLPEEPDFAAVDYGDLNDFLKSCSRSGHVINSRFFLRHIPDYFQKRLRMPIIRPSCRLPYIYLECNSYGNVSPCMVSTGWESGVSIEDLFTSLGRQRYRELQRSLERCRKCDETMFICCWEPMIHFPLSHFIRYGLLP